MESIDYYSFERKELLEFIPTKIEKSLDVGCAIGLFSENLKKTKQAEVWGIEMVEEIAEVAKTKLDKVLIGSFDGVYDQLPKGYFDCVFFNDVLEHMTYPEDCLLKIRECLSPKGVVFASLPNVRYIDVLLELIVKGDWEYKESGIMDKTHFRFFTKKSMKRMFESCGFEIKSMNGINGVGSRSLTSILNTLMFNKIEDVKYKQYVVIASLK